MIKPTKAEATAVSIARIQRLCKLRLVRRDCLIPVGVSRNEVQRSDRIYRRRSTVKDGLDPPGGASSAVVVVNVCMGQSRHFDRAPLTLDLPPTPDILSANRHVGIVPLAEANRESSHSPTRWSRRASQARIMAS